MKKSQLFAAALESYFSRTGAFSVTSHQLASDELFCKDSLCHGRKAITYSLNGRNNKDVFLLIAGGKGRPAVYVKYNEFTKRVIGGEGTAFDSLLFWWMVENGTQCTEEQVEMLYAESETI